MKDKTKIIHIEHCSHSYFLADKNGNPDDIVKGSWGTQVATQLKKFHPEFDVECWFPEKIEKTSREFQYKGIKIKIFPTTFSPRYAMDFSLSMIKALKEEIRRCREKKIKLIIHLHEYHNFHGIAFSFLFKKEKLIAQHHGGSWPLKHLRQTKNYRKLFPFFFIWQFLEIISLKNIKCFFALSEGEINYLKKISNSKIKFQTMGIEDNYFKKIDKKTARKKLKLPANKKILLYIGRINEEKGMKYLLDSMSELKNVELKVIGYLQDLDYFKNYAKENNLSNVEFLGAVFGDKKMLYLSACDALILPSSKEGAPVVIMEAMSRNLPVVATNVGGIPLMVDDRENGIIIKPKSKLEIIKAVSEILKWKKKDFKKYAERYKWNKIIEETAKEYNSL